MSRPPSQVALRRQAVLDMHAEGLSVPVIAAHVGLTPQRIGQIVRAAGGIVPPSPSRPPPIDAALLTELRRGLRPTYRLCAALGVGEARVRHACECLGARRTPFGWRLP